jgi:MFS family permease
MQRTQSPLTISVVAPALWILVLIAGLPLLSESAYSPALPAMAHDLKTSAGMAENTLAIYLVGLAFGTLFWGYISDLLGRKPCILAGFGLFAAACLGCYSSTSIEMLMGFRLLQALGGSVGSVLSQAVARDAFQQCHVFIPCPRSSFWGMDGCAFWMAFYFYIFAAFFWDGCSDCHLWLV